MSTFEGIGDEVLYAVITVVIGTVLCYILIDWTFLRSWLLSIFGETEPPSTDEAAVPVRPYNGGQCPICLQNNTTLGLETNCGHVFCGACLIQYWHQRGMGPVTCPLCRQRVNMMFAVFSPEERAAEDTSPLGSNRQRVVRDMHQYNRNYSGQPRTMIQMIRDAPVLVRHMIHDFLEEDAIMRMFQLRIFFCVVGGVLYLFSPLDILPEALFGLLGLIDDALVLLMIFVYLSSIYRHVMVNRAADAAVTAGSNGPEQAWN